MLQTFHRTSLFTVFFLAALLLASAQIVGAGSAAAETSEDKKTLMEAAADERDKAIQAGERLLADIDSRLEKVEQEIEEASEDAKARWMAERERLSAMRADADTRLDGLRESTSNAWDNFKQSFSEAYDDLEAAVQEAQDKYIGQ